MDHLSEYKRSRGVDRRSVMQRFFESVVIDSREKCWIWTGAAAGFGHGRFWDGSKVVQAHRYSFKIFKQEPKTDSVIMHSCDNPPCVNPAHLFEGTQMNNVHDCIIKGRFKGHGASLLIKGTCKKGHYIRCELDTIPSCGGKYKRCKKCAEEYNFNYRKMRKEKKNVKNQKSTS